MREAVKLLQNITIVDLGSGMAAALISKFLADNGARIIKVGSGAGAWESSYYPAYPVWYRDAEYETEAGTSADKLEQLLSVADACIVGGENWPGLGNRPDAEQLSDKYPQLVVLDISGNPKGTAGDAKPSTDLLAQARTGLCWEQYTDKPIVMAFEPANYGAALQGLCGLLAALYERNASGLGQVVKTSLFEGSLTWVMQLWGEFENVRPETLAQPKDLHPLVFKCRDGIYIHIVLGSSGSKYKLYKVLGIDDPTVLPGDSGMPNPANLDRRNFFGDIDLLSEHVAKFDSQPLLEKLWAEGLPVEQVFAPSECWDNAQVQYNGIIRKDNSGGRHVGNPVIVRENKSNQTLDQQRSPLPLGGIKVMDFGAYVAGPLASRILADLGADVIKVEPIKGDPARGMLRSYMSANRGKKGLSLDLKSGAAITRKLVQQADVVTNNFRSGVSQRLGIDPASLHALRDNMIVLESPGYGASGPLAGQAAFDLVMQALCGHEAKGAGEGNPPFWNRTYMVDFAGGMLGAVAVLAALNYRARSGNGVSLETPLLNAGVFLQSEVVQSEDGSVQGARTLNSTQTGYFANEALYQVKDGWVAIVARDSTQKAALAKVLEIANELPADAIWGEKEYRLIASAVAGYSATALDKKLSAADVWMEICRKTAEKDLLNDPLFDARGTVKTTHHPVYGKIKDISALVSFSRSRVGSDRYIHHLGEHTAEILKDANFSEAEIQQFQQQQIAK